MIACEISHNFSLIPRVFSPAAVYIVQSRRRPISSGRRVPGSFSFLCLKVEHVNKGETAYAPSLYRRTETPTHAGVSAGLEHSGPVHMLIATKKEMLKALERLTVERAIPTVASTVSRRTQAAANTSGFAETRRHDTVLLSGYHAMAR